MSRNEDYLDNLLTSVTDKLNEFDEDFEQSRESFRKSYQTKNDLPQKTQSALDEIREDNFLKEFEEGLQSDGSEDDFIRQFEKELNDEADGLYDRPQVDDYVNQVGQIVENPDTIGQDGRSLEIDTMSQPDVALEDIVGGNGDASGSDAMFGDMTGSDATFGDVAGNDAMFSDASGNDAMFSDVVGSDAVFGNPGDAATLGDADSNAGDMANFDDFLMGDEKTVDFGNVTEASNAGEDVLPQVGKDNPAELPEDMKGLEDIFNDISQMGAGDVTQSFAEDTVAQPAADPAMQDFAQGGGQPVENEAPQGQDFMGGFDAGLDQILNESDDKELSELNQMLNAGDQIGLDAGAQQASAQGGFSEDDLFSMGGPDFPYEDIGLQQPESGGDKEKKERKNGPFAKLSRILFGTPEELNPELAEQIAIANELAGEPMDPEEIKAKKKLEKEEKKKARKEAAEQKKQEREAAKAEKAAAKASKPKKVKKPKAKLPKEPPLPKVPVAMMWILALSCMVMILLGTSLIGYSTSVSESKEAFEKGDYVTAHAKLLGVKVRNVDEELYQASAALAGVQAQLDAYTALMERKQYEMALDALIRGIGRCELHSADAEEWGVTDELEAFDKQLKKLLKEQFDVSSRKAMKLYKINKRSDYTLKLHEILSGLGLY